jgi:hypothetical protein
MVVMLAKRGFRTFLCGFTLCASGLLLAAEAEAPDIDFLEYLGMWEDSDEDWLLLNEIVVVENEERNDSVPEGEESAENEDES